MPRLFINQLKNYVDIKYARKSYWSTSYDTGGNDHNIKYQRNLKLNENRVPIDESLEDTCLETREENTNEDMMTKACLSCSHRL